MTISDATNNLAGRCLPCLYQIYSKVPKSSLILFRNLIKHALQKEHSKFLDELQWERKVREQAVRVAEYLALVWQLKEEDPPSEYKRANQLSWELAMWLPEDIYKQMTQAIANPSSDANVLDVTVSVRKILLGKKAGNLTQDHIAFHKPGIGKKSP